MSHQQSVPTVDFHSISMPITVFRYTMFFEPVPTNAPKFRVQTVHKGKTTMEYSSGFLNNVENKQNSWNKIMFFNSIYLYDWNAKGLYLLFETNCHGSFLCRPSLFSGSFTLDIVHHQPNSFQFSNSSWVTETIPMDWNEHCIQHSLFSFCHYFRELSQQRYFHKALSLIFSDRTIIPVKIESENDLKWILDNLYERVCTLANQQSIAVFEDNSIRGMESHVELRRFFKSKYFQPPKPQSLVLRGIHRNSQSVITEMPEAWHM